MSGPRLTYRFGPLERRGLFGALRGGQVLIIAATVAAALTLLNSSPTPAAAMLVILVITAGLAVALVPFGRHGADEWLPVLGGYLARALGGRRTFRSARPQAGIRGGADTPDAALPPVSLPPVLRGVELTEVAYRGRTIGAVAERGGRRLTAVLACRVAAFSLLDPEAQERRLARWGLVLSGAAGTPIRRLGWVERTAPAQGDELARWLHDERDPAIPLRGTPIIESYLELIGASSRITQEHEILVPVQVDAGRVRERGADAIGRALVNETERVAQGLEAAEVAVLGALGTRQLARALRTAFDPFGRAELAALEAVEPERCGPPAANAGPLGTQESWEHFRSDGALHCTYWIAGWPRVDVSPMFMDALLGRSGAVRAVAVTFEPIAPQRSTREAEAAITRDRADRELRRRFGQSETARQRQAQEATARREAELAAGHSEVRLAGFITVSGRDEEELRRACAEVAEHAARARLELHRMYGQQADAFTFTLPLCRGLR